MPSRIARPGPGRWRRAWLRLHSLAGLAAGAVLALMGLTGALMSFEDEILEWVNPGLRVADAGAARRPYAELLPELARGLDGARISFVQADADGPLVVGVIRQSASPDARAARYAADPASGRLLGEIQGSGFFDFVRRLHRWLALPGGGDGIGRVLTGCAAAALAGLALSGWWLGWRRAARPDGAPPATSVAAAAHQPPSAAPWRTRAWHRAWHVRLGLWLAPLYLLSALSGLWWSSAGYRAALGAAADFVAAPGGRPYTPSQTRGRPTPPREAPARPEAPAPQASPRQIGAAADAVLADIAVPAQRILLGMPRTGGTMRLRWLPRGAAHPRAYDDYRIDPASARVVEFQPHAGLGPAQRLEAAMLPLHTGTLFGLPMRLLLMLSSLALALFAASGTCMYILRRRRSHADPRGDREQVLKEK
ncbi:PepSY-associated TM helix domain-containing protein [Corticibacter populi]|nr:PepSY-associated TM helix domain-containing protein [Corticibacter populi]RZS31056.1 sulfite reductase (NADPH) flavoprotein alpha-component [Corticibacter populi]